MTQLAHEPPASEELRTSAAAARGNRLMPARDHRLYWLLTVLREEMERLVESEIKSRSVATVADFGCGNMPYRPLIEPHVERYCGCDLPGNELADSIISSNGVLPFEDSTVDIVVSNQVLEHVRYPHKYLSEARRVLAANGKLILSTHGIWRYHPDPCDFWRWTSAGLRCEIEDAGFAVESFSGILGPEATAIQLWQDAFMKRVPKRFRRWFFRLVQSRIRRADLKCSKEKRDADASHYILVARPEARSA